MSTPAGFTEKCCQPGVITPGNGTGRDVVINGINTYITGDNPDKLIVFSTDVFGEKFPNARTLADYYAEAGFTVIIPDQFNGHPFTKEQMDAPGGMNNLFTEWFPKHPQTAEKLITVLKAVTKEGKYKSVQAVGFCYGAPQVINLLSAGLAKAGAVCHPTRLTVDLASSFNSPILFNCAEKDGAFTPELRAQWQKTLKERGVDAKFIDYPGTEHGFCVRTDGSEALEKAKKKAAENTRDFFLSHA